MNKMDMYDLPEEIDEEIDEEVDDKDSHYPNRKLYTNRKDLSLRELVLLINEGELILQPDYQRGYVWNNKQASKFIESILMRIPVPNIFLSENPDGTTEVIDGQQRLTAVYKFVSNEFRLTGLRTLHELNGLDFENLLGPYRKIWGQRSMSAITLESETDSEIKFDIFQRINEGAIKLNSQELRNVIYRGKLVDAISELTKNNIFASIFASKKIAVLRKRDAEFISRMLAMNELVENHNQSLDLDSNYSGRIITTLINFYEKNRNDEAKIFEMKKQFIDTISTIYEFIGEDMFKLPQRTEGDTNDFLWSPSLSATMAEFEYMLFRHLPKNVDKKLVIKLMHTEVINNIELFQRATGNTAVFNNRINIINKILKEI